jgi:hypothetical protein
MKKSIYFGLIFILILLLLPVLIAQEASIGYEAPAPGIPPGVGGIEFDEETGLPGKFSTVQNQTYLKQELTRVVEGMPVIGPFFDYTDSFFSVFNPLWVLVFGVEFAWSWEFFLSLGIWIVLIIFVYSPTKAFLNLGALWGLLGAMVIASLVGVTGIIAHFVGLLETMLTEWWMIVIAISVAVLLTMMWYYLMKRFEVEAKAEKLQRSKDIIHAEAEPYRRKHGL